MTRMKIYLASSWRNQFQGRAVEMLREAGFEVYDFKNPAIDNHGFHWSEIDCRYGGWMSRQFRDALSHDLSEKHFGMDFGAMQWADACILLLPCGRSAHLEAGWFAGQGKPLVIILDAVPEPELMYKMASHIAINITEAIKFLREL